MLRLGSSSIARSLRLPLVTANIQARAYHEGTYLYGYRLPRVFPVVECKKLLFLLLLLGVDLSTNLP